MKKRKEVLDVLDYSEPITKIYFVRHGQTRANKERLVVGQWDLPLNDLGKKQALRAGSMLAKIEKKEKIDLIIASPLKRTRQTAKLVASKLKVKKIITDPNIMEKSEGHWEGSSYWQIREKDPKNYYKWLEDPFRIKTPGGESVVDLKRRVEKFRKMLLSKYRGKNIVVASHSGPIRMFALNILDTDVDKFWCLKVENGSITEVHLSKKHTTIWAINRV